MRKIILFALVPLIFSSVACNKRNTEPFKEYDIRGKLYDTEIFARMPHIAGMDSLLIVYQYETTGKLVTIYSPEENMKEITSFGTKGRGPGEYYALGINSTHGNRFFGTNMNMQELVVAEVTRDSSRVEIREVERLKFDRIVHDDIAFQDNTISYLDEGHFVGLSYGGPGKFFSLYDNRMNWLTHFGNGPVEEDIKITNTRMYLNGYMATNNGALVFAPMRLPKILFYGDMKEGGVPRKKWEDTFYNSFFKINNGRIGFDDTRTVGVVRNVEMGDKYIYVLFLDIPLSKISMAKTETSAANIIFVYDYEGNRIARLNLDYRINDFCVDPNDAKIYGIAPIPEYHIVEFDLPEF